MRHNSDASRSIRSGYHRGSMLELREATTTVSAVNPCRTAFRRDGRLQLLFFGPVLLSALPSVTRSRDIPYFFGFVLPIFGVLRSIAASARSGACQLEGFCFG